MGWGVGDDMVGGGWGGMTRWVRGDLSGAPSTPSNWERYRNVEVSNGMPACPQLAHPPPPLF